MSFQGQAKKGFRLLQPFPTRGIDDCSEWAIEEIEVTIPQDSVLPDGVHLCIVRESSIVDSRYGKQIQFEFIPAQNPNGQKIRYWVKLSSKPQVLKAIEAGLLVKKDDHTASVKRDPTQRYNVVIQGRKVRLVGAVNA